MKTMCTGEEDFRSMTECNHCSINHTPTFRTFCAPMFQCVCVCVCGMRVCWERGMAEGRGGERLICYSQLLPDVSEITLHG